MNLLGNAFKFMPDGGLVRCSLRHSAEEITFAVDDSGPSVTPELRQAIFERFRQGDGGINRTVAGTGLGLAIAKEFVEMHKGRIDVLDSDLGGARFEVRLPLKRVDAGVPVPNLAAGIDHSVLDGVLEELRFAGLKPKAVRPVPEPVTAGRPRVLVVEDNPDMNRFVAESLSRDYDVATAFDGRDGLEQALRFNPMVVVSDIMMPHVSGVEMVAQMRARRELRQTQILLLSAKADEELMVQLLDQGAQDFIVKPFSERDLLVRVRNLVLGVQAREATELQKLMKLRGEPGSERERPSSSARSTISRGWLTTCWMSRASHAVESSSRPSWSRCPKWSRTRSRWRVRCSNSGSIGWRWTYRGTAFRW